jgi:hypothetical protein
VPDPAKLDEVGEFEALLVNDALADAAPVAVGVKCTVNDTGVPTFTVTGNVKPVTENSVGLVPLKATDDTTTVAVLAVNVPLAVPLVPTTTLPTLIGLVTLSVPCEPTEDPDSGIVRVGFCASDVTVMLPLKVPGDCGVNFTLNEALCPAVNVTGGVMPEKLNPVPAAATWLMCASDPPVFFRVSVWDEFWPTWMLVNVMLVGFAVKFACVTPVPDSGIPIFAEPVTVSDMVPDTTPALTGSNVTLNVDV